MAGELFFRDGSIGRLPVLWWMAARSMVDGCMLVHIETALIGLSGFFNFNFNSSLFHVYGHFACVYVCLPRVYPVLSEARKKVSDSLDPELQVVMSLCVGDRK